MEAQVFFPFANLTLGDENEHLTIGGGYLGGYVERTVDRTISILRWSM